MSENLSNPKPSKNYAIASNFSGQFDEVAAVDVASVSALFASFKHQSSRVQF